MDFRRKSVARKIEQITGTRERQKNRTLMFIFSLVIGLIIGGLAIMLFVGIALFVITRRRENTEEV